jgi:phage terminase large subunit-like protein
MCNHFGKDRVFMDVDSIGFGKDFVTAVRQSLAENGILLALIAQDWLTAKESKGRRRIDVSIHHGGLISNSSRTS